MIDLETIAVDFKHKVCEQITLEPEGNNRYRVSTPFMFGDGDHLVIALKRINDNWFLTDEAHTYMHLTYSLDEKDLKQGTRQTIISNVLSVFGVDDREGELTIKIENGAYGNALYSFIQALLKITDVTYLSRERVHSTFLEDFRSFMEEQIPSNRRIFEWHDPKYDSTSNYTVDLRVNGMEKPLFVFAVNGDNKARDVTINLLQYERWNLAFRTMAIFENQEEISRKVLARLSDVCEKQFSNLGVTDRITRYLKQILAD